MRTNLFRYLFASCLVTLFLLSSASGQTVTGSIAGVVTDPSGAVVAGAKVVSENTATGVRTSVLTNSAGVYTLRFLPIGTYTVTISAKGFATQKVEAFPLEIDQTAKVDAKLTISDSTTVEVRETIHPILDTTDATLGNTLSTNEIANIPLNGRNFSSLTLFQPGAVDTDPTGMTGNNAIERNTYNSGIASINGNREQGNNYTHRRRRRQRAAEQSHRLQPRARRHRRSCAWSPPMPTRLYGNANGGADRDHSEVWNEPLSRIVVRPAGEPEARCQFVGERARPRTIRHSARTIQYTQNIFGGTIWSGPILKNKLFFFADYEGVRHHTGQPLEFRPASSPRHMLKGISRL